MAWIEEIKNVQKRDGVTYKQAMKIASGERKGMILEKKKTPANHPKDEKQKIDKVVKDSGILPKEKKKRLKPVVKMTKVDTDEPSKSKRKKKQTVNLLIENIDLDSIVGSALNQ